MTVAWRPLGSAPDADSWRRARLEDQNREQGIARRLLGPDVTLVIGDGAIARTGLHEAGHALFLLVTGTTFHEAWVKDSGDGMVVYEGACRDLKMPSLGNRLGVDVAGVLAEHIVYGSCDVSGAAEDLARALARIEDDLSVLAIMPSARMTLVAHQPALVALADALVARRRLSWRECVDVVARAGFFAPEPFFSPIAPPEEIRRLRAVDAQIAGRRARIERLKEGARA